MDFSWVLQNFSIKHAKIPILETYLTSSSRINEAFGIMNFSVTKKQEISPVQTRYFLNALLDLKSPMMKSFDPREIICILYYSQGVRALNAKEILSIPASRIYSMKISSIHTSESKLEGTLYKVVSQQTLGVISSSVERIIKFPKYLQEFSIEDVKEEAEKIIRMITPYIVENHQEAIENIEFDMFLSTNSTAFLVKTKNIKIGFDQRSKKPKRSFCIQPNKTGLARTATSVDPKILKKRTSLRLCVESPKMPDFIEMVAKTIDRTRKETWKSKPILTENKGIGSLGELITAIEDTRPRV